MVYKRLSSFARAAHSYVARLVVMEPAILDVCWLPIEVAVDGVSMLCSGRSLAPVDS